MVEAPERVAVSMMEAPTIIELDDSFVEMVVVAVTLMITDVLNICVPLLPATVTL